MKRKDGARASLLARIRRGYDRAVFNRTRMELTGSSRAVIEGAKEILAYGNECIRLSVRDTRVESVIVNGCELRCLSYHPDAVVIEGEIASVCFCAGKGE